MTRYRIRILEHIRSLVDPLGPIESAIDFGSGDGYFASQWEHHGLVESVTAVDVVERRKTLVAPRLYDGARLPFADRSFELAYAVDVLHHCDDPAAALSDLSRCSNKYLLIKDHTYVSCLGRWALAAMDEMGNRRFGIPSPYLYQRGWEWVAQVESSGWRRVALVHPLHCHTGVLGLVTNKLQFIGLWKRGNS